MQCGRGCQRASGHRPAQCRVRVVRRPKYACRTCGDVVAQSPAPALDPGRGRTKTGQLCSYAPNSKAERATGMTVERNDPTRAARIRELNGAFRTNLDGGRVRVTCGIVDHGLPT